MKSKTLLIFIFFLTYSIITFITNNIYIILGLTIIEILFIIIFKINLYSLLNNLKKCLPFCLMVLIFNLLFTKDLFSIIYSYKLLLVCSVTFIISNLINWQEFSKIIALLFKPLQCFGYKTNEIALTISISLNFIFVMKDELICIKKSLISKNFNFTFYNVIKRPHIFLITYFNSIFYKVNALEKSMRSKLYE